MSNSTLKKTDKKSAPTEVVAQTPSAQTPAPAKAPALIAYYAMPVPKGQQPTAMPIGAAIAHPDGAGFTLQLHLMPPAGAHILLRVPPQAKKAP